MTTVIESHQVISVVVVAVVFELTRWAFDSILRTLNKGNTPSLMGVGLGQTQVATDEGAENGGECVDRGGGVQSGPVRQVVVQQSSPSVSHPPTARRRSSSIFGSSRQVEVNVGGTVFLTTMSTLCNEEESYFAACLRFTQSWEEEEEEEVGGGAGGLAREGGNAARINPISVFVDRDATHFRHILNFLRDGRCPHLTPNADQQFVRELLAEARFYQVKGLIAELEKYLEKKREEDKHGLSSEKEYKMVHVRRAKDIESTFKIWIQRGYELEHMTQLVRPGGFSSPLPGSPSPTRRGNNNNNGNGDPWSPHFSSEDLNSFGEVHVLMMFSKNLTKADVSFFDRLMGSS